jgi:hypothetical protein
VTALLNGSVAISEFDGASLDMLIHQGFHPVPVSGVQSLTPEVLGIELTLAEATPGVTPGSHIEVALPLSDCPEILTKCGSFCSLGCAISLADLPRGFTMLNEDYQNGDNQQPMNALIQASSTGPRVDDPRLSRRAECPSWNPSCRCAGGRS